MPEKFYITTSIAYTNAPPHIGYALELIQADVLARYHKLLGEDVFFLTGTDEHGVKIERKAKEEGKTPKEFTNEISEKFKELTKALNISNNDFIRTTEGRHQKVVESVWADLLKNRDIEERAYKGLYCVGCEAFVKEKDLIDGKCPNHQKEPEIVEEKNYFFKLSKYSKEVEEKIQKNEIEIIPETRKNEILSFMGQGVEDISISRPKEKQGWGIPVPGDNSQTIYVWFEALINYLSPEKYWPANIHCIGKDIFRFHALMWPAMLLAMGKKCPKKIFVHGYLTVGGQKMSKSLGNVVDPFELVEKYGADAVRYFLLREISSTEDGDFTEEKFKERYNGDLANGIGNTVSRILALAKKKYNGVVPTVGIDQNKVNPLRDYILNQVFPSWEGCFSNGKVFYFNICLEQIIRGFKKIDEEIGQNKPWEWTKKESESEVLKEVFYSWLAAIRVFACMIFPFLPDSAEKILSQFDLNTEDELKNIKWGGLKAGTKIKKGDPLFPRLK